MHLITYYKPLQTKKDWRLNLMTNRLNIATKKAKKYQLNNALKKKLDHIYMI